MNWRVCCLWLSIAAWPGAASSVSLLTWNVAGNGATDWTTNAPQVRAIGRIVRHLRPDLLTLQEIPFPHSAEMTNFVAAFLPGYHLARFSGTDGHVRSVILSRHPILREQRWLNSALLTEFGYEGRFTRDLFEAEIAVPGWPLPLHVFTTHLKAGFDADSVTRRGAEALAISNFVVNTHHPAHPGRPFVLTGDLNEDDVLHATFGAGVLPRLANDATGLRLTTPVNPFTGSERTFSARASLSSRLDYILPDGRLFSNIVASQVFRTGPLPPPPGDLLADDDRTASDHLAVWMTFGNPFPRDFRVTRLRAADGFLALEWESQPGRRYTIQTSSNLTDWAAAATGVFTGGATGLWVAGEPPATRFYRLFLEPAP